jgi:hypothetical protein
MNKEKTIQYLLVFGVLFTSSYIFGCFIEGALLLPQGGRTGVVICTLIAMYIYIMFKENI